MGSIVLFGSYEQDGDMSNGPESIEWRVLDIVNGKALLISQYGLDQVAYHYSYEDITYENSGIRTWLNNDFLNCAFTVEEQNYIPETVVENKDNQSYGSSGGNNTRDKLFLLSIEEVKKYFNDNTTRSYNDSKGNLTIYDDRLAIVTKYAMSHGTFSYDYLSDTENVENGTGYWWLRSPGLSQQCAAFVDYFGRLDGGGYRVSFSHASVRPAFWIYLP